jgi:hypothetical protein
LTSPGETIPIIPGHTSAPPHGSHPEPPLRPAPTAIRGPQHYGSSHPQDPPIRTETGFDEVMKPIIGRGEPPDRSGNVANLVGNEALSARLNQQPAATACTATLSKSDWKCPSWDGVFTIYPSATIRTTSVDCKGCDYVDSNEIHFCPNMQITATKTASTASTFWTTVCAPSGVQAQATQPAMAAITPASNPIRARIPAPEPASIAITAVPTPTAGLDPRQGVVVLQPLACPTTVVVQPGQSAGKTQTTHARYTTTTLLVPCGSCSLVVTTGLFGYGPPGVFTKTTTIPVGTRTAYACL